MRIGYRDRRVPRCWPRSTTCSPPPSVAAATSATSRRGINRFRWVEYSFSATLMILLIGAYSGITDITAVLAIVGANVGMILFGWLQERMNPPGRARPRRCCRSGSAPSSGSPRGSPSSSTSSGPRRCPASSTASSSPQFVFFFSFGLNQWLQYRQVGRWADYVYGEKVYLVLSLGAKSVLAWQIFGGSLGT